MKYTELNMRDSDIVIRGSDPYGTMSHQQRQILVSQSPYEVEIRTHNAIVRKQGFIELNRFDRNSDEPGNLIKVNYRLIEHMETRTKT